MQDLDNRNNYIQVEQVQTASRSFVANVFLWMFMALSVSALTAWVFANSPSLFQYLIREGGKPSGLGMIVMFAPLGLIFLMSLGYQRLSAFALSVIYALYAVIMGISLSFILLAYTAESVYVTFGTTAAVFGFMALLGYTTKTDLTKMGSILLMALIGIIIASLVNYFMHSSQLAWIINIAGVIIFTGLTAYDVQKIKNMSAQVEQGTESANKLTIMAALTLYLDFINLFLFLLRFMGSRK
jgi:uncharacterized protein